MGVLIVAEVAITCRSGTISADWLVCIARSSILVRLWRIVRGPSSRVIVTATIREGVGHVRLWTMARRTTDYIVDTLLDPSKIVGRRRVCLNQSCYDAIRLEQVNSKQTKLE